MKKELIFSLVGYICLLKVGAIMGLWIYVSDSNRSYDEVQHRFIGFFPTMLANGRLICAISVVIAGIGIFSISVANKHILSKIWKGINTAVIVLLGLILFLNLWSLM